MDLDTALARLALDPSAPLDLAELALLLARDEYPALDVESELAELAAMARDFRVGLAGAGADPGFASSIGAELLAGDPVAAAAAL